MRIWKKLTSKKAISPLIATLILVGVAVAGGIMVYSLFFSTAGTLGARGVVTVESSDLVMQTDGTVVFSTTIKNAGTKPVIDLTVTLNGEDPATVTLPAAGVLQPGQSAILVLNSDGDGLTQTYIVGNAYNIVVTATFSDGSTYITTTSVTCRM